MVELITLDDVQAAAARIHGSVMQTPCIPSETLSRITGSDLVLKFENLQFTASFKERGALNKLLRLRDQGQVRGVCAMSAGNHAQGVAYHAKRLGIAATIVMPVGTPMTKIRRTRDHGARVLVEGASLDEALAAAKREAELHDLTFVHPFDDPDVIAGQGTVGLEIIEQAGDLDAIVVPIGGGGLISGIAIAAKALNPAIRVIGVQSCTYPSMARVVRNDVELVVRGTTIAEGIAVKQPGMLTRQIVGDLVDEILLVEEASIERAIALLQSIEKTVVEGAGAAGLAALLEHPDQFAGRRVAVPLTGGNIDSRMFASVIIRDLVRQGQLARIATPISDQPGALASLATILANEGANIVDVAHERLSLALNPKDAALDLVVELEGEEHRERVFRVLEDKGFEPVARTIG